MRNGALAPLWLAALFAACSSNSGAGVGPGGGDASDDFSVDAPGESASDASFDGAGPVDAHTDSPADAASDTFVDVCPPLSPAPVTLAPAVGSPTAGVTVRIDASGDPGANHTTYVNLAFSGPGGATATWIGATGNGPWTWSWNVTFSAPGAYCVSFTSDSGAYTWGNRTIDVLPGSGDASAPVFVHTTGGSFAFPNGAAGFVGMNTRGLPHYGTSLLQYATTAQIGTQLDAVHSIGGLVVRVFAAGHDGAASTVATRLGAVLDAAQARGLYVIAALTDFYATGFSPQGDDGAYVSMNGYTILSDSWFAGGYQTNYLPWVDAVVSQYKDHPALFAWELGNELKDNATPANYVSFATAVAQHIRSIDPNHMITTGAISTINASLRAAGDVSSGTLAYQVYSDASLSFLTTHDYDGEMTDDDTDLAGALSKPIVIEEEGFSTADGDRPSLVLSNGGAWRGKGARGYMQWGFLALTQDNGDGDTTYGMDQVWHQADWSGMVGSYSTLAGQYR